MSDTFYIVLWATLCAFLCESKVLSSQHKAMLPLFCWCRANHSHPVIKIFQPLNGQGKIAAVSRVNQPRLKP